MSGKLICRRHEADYFRKVAVNQLRRLWACVAAGWLLLAVPVRSEPATAQEILDSIKARARLSSSNNTAGCEFQKVLTVEELDKDGTVLKTNEMVFKVVQSHGLPKSTLISTNGKPPAENRSNREKGKERRNRGQGNSSSEKDEEVNPWLDDDLIGRFDFTLTGEQEVEGRKIWILTFEPKAQELPNKNFIDRFLNRLHGELRVDQAESEVTYLEIKLIDQVKVWGGILGQLEDMAFKIHRQSVARGVWVQSASEGFFVARKLFSSIRYRTREETSGYRMTSSPDEQPKAASESISLKIAP